MFGIGPTELIVFLVIVLLAVGPDRLPTFMRTVGKGLRQVRHASREFRDAIGLDELMREDPFRPEPKVRPPRERPVPVNQPSRPPPASKAAVEAKASETPGESDDAAGQLQAETSTGKSKTPKEPASKEGHGDGDTSAEANQR